MDKIKQEYRDEIVTYVTKFIKTDQPFLRELLTELTELHHNQRKAEQLATEPLLSKPARHYIEFTGHIVAYAVIFILGTLLFSMLFFGVLISLYPIRPAECVIQGQKQDKQIKLIHNELKETDEILTWKIAMVNSILFKEIYYLEQADERQQWQLEQLWREGK